MNNSEDLKILELVVGVRKTEFRFESTADVELRQVFQARVHLRELLQSFQK